MRVSDQVTSWEEGRLLVFDETHEHEVWNDTDQNRVVLLFYVVRPLPLPLAVLNRLVFLLSWLIMRQRAQPPVRD
jgi:beta-hydroxylase